VNANGERKDEQRGASCRPSLIACNSRPGDEGGGGSPVFGGVRD